MKAVPMIFNTEMVQALVDGRKSVTRRPVKLSPHSLKQGVTLKDIVKVWRSKEEHLFSAVLNDNFDHVGTFSVPCRTGDLIYVRETFCADPDCDHDSWDYHEMSYQEWIGCECSPAFLPDELKNHEHCIYKASGVSDIRWTPSIHMPRWASRLTLEITGVRIEQLSDLRESRGSVVREGFDNWPQFKHVWEGIYGQSHPNDYVWVIEFKVIHKNVDQVLREMEVAA